MAESTHHLGVRCQVCTEVLEPDTCCRGRAHGYSYQQPCDWATQTWPTHPCFSIGMEARRG